MAALDSTQELLDAQTHLWNLIFIYINSMSLKSAIQLGIPDAIHKHGNPITLSQLADVLSINKAKSNGLFRLMRILVHSKIFDKVKISKGEGEEEEEAYSLTRVSRLLLRDEPFNFASFALAMLGPGIVDAFHNPIEWYKDESPSPFNSLYGRSIWEYVGDEPSTNQLFNEGMACDARFVGSVLIKECKKIFEGLESVVDVAGGTGEVAKAVAAAFPDIKCVVLDLPHVVDGLEGSENLSFVSGDMFEFIPPADALLLKEETEGVPYIYDMAYILTVDTAWSDEECIKILEKCKEAITQSKNENRGKFIVIDMILDDDEKKQESKATETQLGFDMFMMTVLMGKERSEKEWAHLFFTAGFKTYKIYPVLGLRSVIEVFP